MGSDGSRSGPRPQSEPVCASCGRPVGTAIKRHKRMGVYVPVWGPGPCHNPECDACVDERVERAKRVGRVGRVKRVKRVALGEPEPVEAEVEADVESEADAEVDPAPARSDDD